MTTYYLKSGNTFRVSSGDAMDMYEALPAGNYVVKHNPMTGFYLEGMPAFSVPSRVYGDHVKDARKILRTFNERPTGTGGLENEQTHCVYTVQKNNFKFKILAAHCEVVK
jgi:hypothetical protein